MPLVRIGTAAVIYLLLINGVYHLWRSRGQHSRNCLAFTL